MIFSLSILNWVVIAGMLGLMFVAAFKAKQFWADMGVSAVLALIMTVGVLVIFFGLGVWKDKTDDAIILSAPLLLVLREILANYFQKRREDNQQRHEKEMAGLTPSNGEPPPNLPKPPGA